MISSYSNDIPLNSRICIYGSGKVGIFFKRYLELTRKDVQIVCFLNSFKTGIVDNLEVINISDIDTIRGQYDLVVVTVAALYSVEAILSTYNVENYIDVNINALMCIVDFLDENLKFSQLISEAYYEENRHNFEKAQSVFRYKEDQELFNLVVKARRTEEDFNKLFDHSLMNITAINNLYFDFVNKKAIKNVIDGGAFNGATSIKFLNHFENIENIYAFEPLYDLFKNLPYSKTIENNDKIKICQYAISNEKTKIKFKENDQATSCFFEENKNNNLNKFKNIEKEVFHLVQAISIDEFVKENAIEKIDFIKFDIEGAEFQGLKGAERTLIAHRPQLAICLYHRNEDFYEIPIYLNEILKNYTFRFSHPNFGYWDSILYAIPDELDNQ